MSIRMARLPPSDVLIASGLLAAALTEVWVTRSAPGPVGLGSCVAVLSTVPVAWRRVRPELGVGLAVLAILLPTVLDPGQEVDGLVDLVAWLVSVHAINAYRDRPVALAGTAAVAGSLAAVIVSAPASPGHVAVDVAWAVALVVAAAAAGQVLRSVEQRHETERAAAEELARAAERRRIARELHDVVAHGLALMVVQAGAARELLGGEPQRAAELLDGVQAAGGRAATELRRMLGLLADAEPDTASQHQFVDLPDLVSQAERAGLPTTLTVDVGHESPPDVQRAAYRVVQEGLTNAIKHGVRRELHVSVRSTASALVVEVTDRGSGGAARAGGAGRGLAGLRERLAFHAGTLTVVDSGPDWCIRAEIPHADRPGTPGAGHRVEGSDAAR